MKKVFIKFISLAVIFFSFCAFTSYPAFYATAFADEDYEIIEISSAEELKDAAYIINTGLDVENCYYLLTADIDLSEMLSDGDGGGWTPIGVKTIMGGTAFTGVFDGGGHTVSGLWIDAENLIGAGFFAYNKGTVKNLNIGIDGANGGIKGGKYVGGICGFNKGIIENCAVTGGIVFGKSMIGGVCGENEKKLFDCRNSADIYGNSATGGICGQNSGDISGSQNSGDIYGVTSEDYVSQSAAGIAGISTAGSIKRCANYGAVIATGGYNGGITGNADGETEVYGCMNGGAVSGDYYTSGVCGAIAELASMSYCFNAGITANYDSREGGAAGTVINCFYIAGTETAGYGTSVSASYAVTKGFLEKLNGGGQAWTLRNPDEFHYYPELLSVFDPEKPESGVLSAVEKYDNAPALSSYILTYGETLDKLTFLTDAEGSFYWQEPQKVLSAGGGVKAYSMFIPATNRYGELYNIAVMLEVLKAQPAFTVEAKNIKAGAATELKITVESGPDNAGPLIEYKKKNAPDSGFSTDIPTKAGSYTVRVVFAETENYLGAEKRADFKIFRNLAPLYICSGIFAGVSLIAAAVFLTNKRYNYFPQIKSIFRPKVIIHEIIVEKPAEVLKQDLQSGVTVTFETLYEKLTLRETEIAGKILEGKQRKEIAAELFVSEDTVKTHINHILRKTDCKNMKMFILKYKP